DDLTLLNRELPEVFAPVTLPEGWDENLIFIPIEDADKIDGALPNGIGNRTQKAQKRTQEAQKEPWAWVICAFCVLLCLLCSRICCAKPFVWGGNTAWPL